MIFGQLMKDLRIDLGMSQEEFALKLECRQSAISKIEAGFYDPNLKTFLAAYRLAMTESREEIGAQFRRIMWGKDF